MFFSGTTQEAQTGGRSGPETDTGHGLERRWLGAASLQRGSADMDVGHSCAAPVQSEAELGQVQLTVLNTLALQDK